MQCLHMIATTIAAPSSRAPMAERPGVGRTRVRTFTISLDWRLIQSTPLRSIHSTNILLAYTRARTVGEVGLKPTLGYRTVPSPHLGLIPLNTIIFTLDLMAM